MEKAVHSMSSNMIFALKYCWKADKVAVIFGLVNSFFYAIQSTYQAIVFKVLIDALNEERSFYYIIGIILLLAVIYGINIISQPISSKLNTRIQMRLEKTMSRELLQKMLFVDSCQFDDPLFYNAIQMAAENTGSTFFSVYQAFQQMLVSLLSGMSGITVLLLLGPDLLVLVAISVIAQLLLAFAINKKRLSYNEEVTPITRRMNYFKEILFERSTSYDIKQYNSLADLLINKYSAAMDDFGDAQGKMVSAATKNSAKTSGIHILLTNIVPYSVLAYRVFNRLTTIADMTAIIASVQQACNMLNSMFSYIPEIKLTTSYVEYFRHILDYEPEIEGQNSGLELGDVESVEFINVSFRYPGVDEDVLSCVNFKIEKGQKIALVGINGAGKTTLTKLLMRFYDVSSGEILINGIDIREYNTSSLRRAVCTVSQELQNYNVKLSEFVSCGEGTNIDRTLVENVLKQVGLYEFVNESGGIDVELGRFFDENGIVLSGGQLQKLMIARMLYKNSSVLIMDEPSAALDPESEYEINRNISSASEGKTVFMISHRLSTTRDADCIILLDGGKIIETGTHERLIAQRGRYAHLFELQASGYNSDGPVSEEACAAEA